MFESLLSPDECQEEGSKGLLLVVELQDQPDKPQVHQNLEDHDRPFHHEEKTI